MPTTALSEAHRLLVEAVGVLAENVGPGADDDCLLSVLTVAEGVARRLEKLSVDAVAALERRGTFTERGYRNTVTALSDLVGWERFEARRRTTAAAQVCARVDLDGTARPARLPATAAVFAAGTASLRHVEAVAKVLGSAAAARLAPQQWSDVEARLADKTAEYTPSQLLDWGTRLVDLLDQDGAEPTTPRRCR